MLIHKKLQLVLLALALCVAPAVVPAEADDTLKADTQRLTEAQAVKIATDFCRSVGRSGLTQNAVITPALVHRDEGQPHHWHPYWHLKLRSQAAPKGGAVDVEVDDLTGDIVGYSTSDAVTGVEREADAIPKSEAITQATDALTRAGAFKSGELKFGTIFFQPIGDNNGLWGLVWNRVVKGVPYRYEGANVLVNAATGAVTDFGIVFHTPPPDSTDFNVTQEQATAIAAQQLAAAGITAPTPPKVKAEVIRPNTFWQPGGDSADKAPYARVAWTVRYESHDSVSHTAEVWVDAQTGAVIGGEYAGSRGGLTLDKKTDIKAAPAQATPTAKPSAPPKK